MDNDIIIIRECREADFEQVLKLLQQLWPDKMLDREKLQDVFLQGLKSEFHIYTCAMLDKTLVGFCSLSVKSSLWQAGLLCRIDEFVVDENLRGKGIGRKILAHVEKIAKEKGCRGIELESGLHRTAAHKFYEKKGFENRAYYFYKKL